MSRIGYDGPVYRGTPSHGSKRARPLEVGKGRKFAGRLSVALGVVFVVGFGAMFLFCVAVLAFVAWQYSSHSLPVTWDAQLWLLGPTILLVLTIVGVVMIVGGRRTIASGRRAAEHMAWLRANGLRLKARVLNAAVPDMDGDYAFLVVGLELEVMGPSAPYRASAKTPLPPDRIGGIVGSEVYVRANPQNLAEVVVDEG